MPYEIPIFKTLHWKYVQLFCSGDYSMDRLTPEHRSWNMSRISGQNTKPEQGLRSMLHREGYRFRKNDKRLPGKPDIVLPMYRTAIFVNGCFWHRHSDCKFAYTPKTRVEFWTSKFIATIKRDLSVRNQLEQADWQVITVWECELSQNPELVMQKIEVMLANRLGCGDVA